MFLRLSEKSDHIFQIYARVVSKTLNNTFACFMKFSSGFISARPWYHHPNLVVLRLSHPVKEFWNTVATQFFYG